MKGKKRLLARMAGYLGLFDHILPFARGRLIVFNYHRIRSDTPHFSTPFDDDVFGPTAFVLREQIKWLKKKAKIISESELIEIVHSGASPGKGCALITFDDAYRDNYDLAYPVLRELGVSAIFFVPTDIIDTRRLGWWDIIAYLIKHTKKTSIDFEGSQFSMKSGRKEAIRFFQRKMALDMDRKTPRLIDRLQEICEAPLPMPEEEEGQLMTWEQIRDMSRNGMTIGAHGHTHKALATLDQKSQWMEMSVSRDILERELSLGINSIAYPVGGMQHFTEGTLQLAKRLGYQLGFSLNTGVNDWEKVDPHNIKRISAPDDLVLCKGAALLPRIFI